MDFEGAFQELSSGLGWGDPNTLPQISISPLANYGYPPMMQKPYPWYMNPLSWPFEFSWSAQQSNGISSFPRSQYHISSTDTSPPAPESLLKATSQDEAVSEILPSYEKSEVELYDTTEGGILKRIGSQDAGTDFQDVIELRARMDEHITQILNHEEQMKLMLKVCKDYFSEQLLQQSEEFQRKTKILEDKISSQEVEFEKQQAMIEERRCHHEEQERRIQELRQASKEQQQNLGSLVKHIDCHYKCIKSLKQNLKKGDEGEIYVTPPSYPPAKRRKTESCVKA